MKTLVVGATGATGQLLVRELLAQGASVKVIVRSRERLPDDIRNHSNLAIVQASLLDLTDAEMAQYVNGCDAVASCLGHNLNLKGIFAPPHRLVTDATRRLCQAIKSNQPEKPVKFVLMNTTGNRNHDSSESVSIAEHLAVGVIRLLVPPHSDNEQAAEYLRVNIGQDDPVIQWVAVRPDGLVNEEQVTPYKLFPSPIRSAIFNAGTTSRINVGHFMAQLIMDDNLWQHWQGKMPVIYNRDSVLS